MLVLIPAAIRLCMRRSWLPKTACDNEVMSYMPEYVEPWSFTNPLAITIAAKAASVAPTWPF
jgi:hypothetical protein